MAEAAFALFAALGSAAAPAAAATAASAGAGAAAAGASGGIFSGLLSAGSGALGILQGTANIASMASTMVGGLGSLIEGRQQAEMATLQGNQEFLASKEKTLAIQRDLAQKVGAARVAFAGSGLELSSGRAVEGDLTNQAAYQTEIEQSNAAIRQQMARMRARQYRSNGALDFGGALLKAAAIGADGGLDIAKRG